MPVLRSCDGAFYKDRDVIVIGGGNSAVEEAIYLANVCKTVKLITHSEKLKCQPYFLETLEKLIDGGKISVIYNAEAKEIIGDSVVNGVEFLIDDNVEKIPTNGVFVSIGRVPDNHLIKGQLKLTKDGFVKADNNMKTNIEGVFVAGDIREKELRQVITACADGAIAGTMTSQYVYERR